MQFNPADHLATANVLEFPLSRERFNAIVTEIEDCFKPIQDLADRLDPTQLQSPQAQELLIAFYWTLNEWFQVSSRLYFSIDDGYQHSDLEPAPEEDTPEFIDLTRITQ
jgi:hypothetical protein